MSRNPRRLTFALLLTLGCAGPALAPPPRTFVKQPAVPAATMSADQDACRKAVLAMINAPKSSQPSARITPGQAVANSFDMRGPAAAEAAEDRCMADKGYAALTLTADENKALSRARDAAGRNQWYDALVAKDLSARLPAAKTAAAAAD